MKYRLKPTIQFQEDALKLKKNEPKYFEKLKKLLQQLEDHPRTGTGHPEQLKHYKVETWSRTVSRKHRLVYEIHEDSVLVILLTTFGHYGDK